jgi:hypothetical protein
MDFRLFDIIANVSSLSVLIPLAFFIPVFKKRNIPATVKLLGVLLFISGLADLLSTILIELKCNPNLVITLYVTLQFIFLSLFYRSAYNLKSLKGITLISVIVFLMFAGYNLFRIQGITGFNSNSFTISSLVFILYAMVLFYRLIYELPVVQIQDFYLFWFNCAIFIYFGFNLFIFISVNQILISQNEQILASWAFHNIMNIIKNVIFAIGLVAFLRNNK